MDGPAGAPMGTGSAELAASASTAGIALVLPGFGGTRLDRVTDLRYATYRQTVDGGNNLAIALQFNVDYDLTDASAGWQGRIVFEPYQGAGGTVLQGTWQSWDAKAGKWWGTRASVPRNGVSVANPCVQATPCTWAQLLATFPNVGVHVTYGAVVLKAGSGWTNFRGNVDALTIAVDGVATTYDFERVAAPPGTGHRLQTTMTDGVVAPTWNIDTTYAAGAQVTYSFASRPGRAEPIVVLDDTLVAASGQVVMTRDRKLQVFSDTLYSYATLQPLERAIADLERQLLFGSDKASAQEAAVRIFLNELESGTDPAALDRATTVAEYVASDPIADSAAIRVTDAALTAFDVMINIYPDPTTPYDVYHENMQDLGPGATTQRTPLSVGSVRVDSRRAARLNAIGRLPSGARIPSGRSGISAPVPERGVLAPSARASDITDYAQFPLEQLYVIYSNGIWTKRVGADLSASLIARRLKQEERFNNWWTTIELRHNRTWSDELAELNRNNPCLAQAEKDATLLSQERVYMLYARCKESVPGPYLDNRIDMYELLRQRRELLSGKLPSNPDVLRTTTLIATRRGQENHVIAVGHSEGTLLVAQAIRALPTLEGHPVNVANRCVAAMALAPLAPSDQFGLDEHHVKGLLANGDAATPLAGGGWRAFDAPLSEAYRQAAPWQLPGLAAKIHFVNPNYLVGAGGDLFATEMMSLHRECLPRRAMIALSTSQAELGSELTADTKVYNQNERELHGRTVGIGGAARRQGQTNSLIAWYPKDEPQQVRVSVTDFIFADAPLTVPVFTIPLAVATHKRLVWQFFAAANGPNGSSDLAPPPTTPPGSCTEHRRFDAPSGGWIEYAAYCETTYTPVFERLTELPGGLSVDDIRVTMTSAPGEAGTKRFDDVCIEDVVCISSAHVEFLHRTYDAQGQMVWDVVGRSGVLSVGGG